MSQQQQSSQSKAGASAPAAANPSLADVRGEQPCANELANLTRDHQADILVAAGYAGVPDEDLKNLRLALSQPDLTLGTVQQIRDKIAELASGRDQKCSDYYVASGCGSITFHGARYTPGTLVRLTEAEAKEFGALVTTTKPPKAQKPGAALAAGNYRVKGPGTIWLDGVQRKPGDVVFLDAKQAVDFGGTVEPSAT